MDNERNQVTAFLSQLIASIDLSVLGDLQEFIVACRNGLLGPALTLWLKKRRWKEPLSMGYATLETPTSNSDTRYRFGCLFPHVKVLLESLAQGVDSFGDKAKVRFFRAEELYLCGWTLADVCGEKGRDHFTLLGLKPMTLAHVLAMAGQCANLPKGYVIPIHDPIKHDTDGDCVLYVDGEEGNSIGVMRTSARIGPAEVLALCVA